MASGIGVLLFSEDAGVAVLFSLERKTSGKRDTARTEDGSSRGRAFATGVLWTSFRLALLSRST